MGTLFLLLAAVTAITITFLYCTANCYLQGLIREICSLPVKVLQRSCISGHCSSREGVNYLSSCGYVLTKGTLGPIIRRLWVGEVKGLENIPPNGTCLVALNHESYFDFLCFTAVIDRKIHFLAAEKFFSHPAWKWLMRGVGAIRVDRNATINLSTMRKVRQAIAQDRLIGIFPEGTRSTDGRLCEAKPGVAHLALLNGIPVIPVGMVGTYEIMSRHDRYPRLRKAEIRIGEPIHLKLPESGKVDDTTLKSATDRIMLAIAALTEEEYPFANEAANA